MLIIDRTNYYESAEEKAQDMIFILRVCSKLESGCRRTWRLTEFLHAASPLVVLDLLRAPTVNSAPRTCEACRDRVMGKLENI